MKKSGGFTLIEILVVVAIIGVLATIGITSYSGLTQKSKDVKKKADIDALADAYELKYNAKDKLYQPLTAADFSGSIPGSLSYSGLLESSAAVFRICANLASDTQSCSIPSPTCYCTESTYGDLALLPSPSPTPTIPATPTPTPTPKPPVACADGTNDQAYSTSMVGCNGTVAFNNAGSLCAGGSSVCQLSQYTRRGGTTTQPTAARWLRDQARSTPLDCPSTLCGGTQCFVYRSGSNVGLLASPNSLRGFAGTCSALGPEDVGWIGADSLNSTHGAMCCN